MLSSTLISTDALWERLADCTLVDCQFDLANEGAGRAAYEAGHIPGAVYASLAADLAGPKTPASGRHPLPSPGAFAETVARLGIDGHRQVVVYDQDSGLFASRLWWMLRTCGHEAVALLDGGLAKWTREGRPTRGGVEANPSGSFVPAPRPDREIAVAEVAQATGRPLLLDARGPDRFEGRSETIDPVAGHIPGAQNRFYKWNLAADGTLLSPDALRDAYRELLGDKPATEVVMYCGSGVSACHNLLAMEVAGLPGARLYVGSWSEWSRDPARPVATGPAQPSR